MIHHLSVGTNDLERARRFYDPLMKLLGFHHMTTGEDSLDYGVGRIIFSVETPFDGRRASPGNGVHIAFEVPDRAAVVRFHALGLAHGGTDDGPPGLRPQYDANYFAAFLRDPDGNKIEAVTFTAV
jgi:catechol 2,3-dioxygenase-like lactoylglutathione lyase family enzyme